MTHSISEYGLESPHEENTELREEGRVERVAHLMISLAKSTFHRFMV